MQHTGYEGAAAAGIPGPPDGRIARYMHRHAHPIAFLKENPHAVRALERYAIFLVGEAHGVAATYSAELDLLRFFRHCLDITDLLLETGYCSAGMLNLYWQTGDASYLDTLMCNLCGSAMFSHEARRFYEQIHLLNTSLPAGHRIRAHGVDIQHQFGTGMEYLHQLLPSGEVPVELQEAVTALRRPDATRQDFAFLRETLQGNRQVAASYLGAACKEFSLAMESIEQGLRFYRSGSYPYREECFVQNFKDRFSECTRGRCLALLGRFHASLQTGPEDQPGFSPVGQHLASEYFLTAGRVASIGMYYSNCGAMSPSGGCFDYHDFPFAEEVERSMGEEKVLFCPLRLPGSPFLHTPAASLHQYAVWIQGSPPAQRYDCGPPAPTPGQA